MSNLPPLFEFASFWMVTSEMADVLRRFELGKTSLYPVELYPRNRRTRVPGDHFILNIAALKHTIDLDQSEGVTRFDHTLPWELKLNIDDNEILLSRAALIGPDLWFEDTIWKAIFLSGPLVQALRDAKLTRRLPLKKGRLADSHCPSLWQKYPGEREGQRPSPIATRPRRNRPCGADRFPPYSPHDKQL